MKKVLIVDDEEDLRDILKDDFELEGFDVVQAAGGYEAIEKLKHNTFDAVISDIRMPEGSGIELLNFVKGDNSAEPKPVVLLITGFADLDEKEATHNGAAGVFRKPFDFIEIVKKVKALLTR